MCKDKITEEGIFLPGLHSHCHQVDDLARFRTKQRTSHYLVRIGVHHHLEESVRIAQVLARGMAATGSLLTFIFNPFLRASASLSRCVKAAGR